MGGTRVSTSSRVVPFRGRVVMFPTRTRVKRVKPVMRVSEAELLEQLGELKRPRESTVVEFPRHPRQPRLF
jgi:hypothetical protein